MNAIVNKVASTLVRAKYFSQNFSPPFKKIPACAPGYKWFVTTVLTLPTHVL